MISEQKARKEIYIRTPGNDTLVKYSLDKFIKNYQSIKEMYELPLELEAFIVGQECDRFMIGKIIMKDYELELDQRQAGKEFGEFIHDVKDDDIDRQYFDETKAHLEQIVKQYNIYQHDELQELLKQCKNMLKTINSDLERMENQAGSKRTKIFRSTHYRDMTATKRGLLNIDRDKLINVIAKLESVSEKEIIEARNLAPKIINGAEQNRALDRSSKECFKKDGALNFSAFFHHQPNVNDDSKPQSNHLPK